MESFSIPKDSNFLGLDCSTQSLKATVLDYNLNIILSETVHFDSDLPHYNTKDGVLRDYSVDGRIVSPTLMWVEALDLLLMKLSNQKLEFDKICAVSGSGQQHGSVYWRAGSSSKLSLLDPKLRLVDQLSNAFTVHESPIWMDSSTTEQCRDIEQAVGGALELARITGSRAYERFTGPQIRKIFMRSPEIYEETDRISLVSSLMASLFIGDYACIDETDGAGMNLMDIKQKIWSQIALDATAPGLEQKIGSLAPAYAVAGLICPYFVERFNFREDCLVIQWSGDNPNSLAGVTLNMPGDIVISLGTSDTVFGITHEVKPSLEGHIFPNPVGTNDYMVMLVYKNGSLIREDIRDCCASRSWEIFNAFLEETPHLNGGKMGFYYKENEITPPLPVGCHRYILKDYTEVTGDIQHEKVDEFDHASEVRALIEGQFLSMRGHAERFGMQFPPKRIIATGGASANLSILRIMASVFSCDVYTARTTDSASLGAAVRAAHGWLCSGRNGLVKAQFLPISSMFQSISGNTSLSLNLTVPKPECKFCPTYDLLVKKRIELENCILEKYGGRI